MPADGGTKKTILVALGVCLVSSIFVSSAAVGLSAIIDQNKKIDRITNILQAGDIEYANQDPEQIFTEKIKSVIVEIESGNVADEANLADELKPENFSIMDVTKNPQFTSSISASNDVAGIKTKPTHMIVYEVLDKEENVEKYILPIYGKGLWSTMYGFIALDKDLQTVRGITFYQHGETPGLGGEVDNPRWKASWKGKTLYDDSGELVLEVIKGQVDQSSDKANRQIDGLSGSTITTRGVDNTIEFWLGENGYGPFIEKLRGGA
ncbi:MAG: Na(+)-translocating NADH-quinone reductase subunit C [Melioribacteraceae bacterium]|nr:MAG: Na(+)-translocating NADH-quinone reductase subunit C [Melioribacteraceae bacterium]